jgi:dolichol-phosphate mannosyltransferase
MNKPFDISVVVPTFREQSNLLQLLPELYEILANSNLHGEIIVVDDDSRDGTDTLCQHLSEHYPLRLIVRRNERGLATAVLRGMNEAKGEIIVVMDADLSHPPKVVPALVKAAQAPHCDVAIGSRYTRNGSVDPKWSCFRRLNSSVATLLARGLTDAADPLSGFFAISKATLSRAQSISPIGYKILLELIVRCECRKIVEIPIAFRDRKLGISKLSFTQQWLYLRHLARLYVHYYLGKRSNAHRLAPVRQDLAEQERTAA